MPYYWKRGLACGLVVGLMLHLLLQQLASRTPEHIQGNYSLERPAQGQSRKAPTPLGPLMGLTIFALCCVMPGPQAK